jgi:hypothetical protein
LLVILGHGGNEFKLRLRSFYRKSKLFVALADGGKVGTDGARVIFENPQDHADEMEAGVDLVIVETLVHRERVGLSRMHLSRFDAIYNGWVSIAPRGICLATIPRQSSRGRQRKHKVKPAFSWSSTV